MTPTPEQIAQVEYQISVQQAFIAGKEIQCSDNFCMDAWNYASTPSWNWDILTYRVKPEPRVAEEFWGNRYTSGISHTYYKDRTIAELFATGDDDYIGPVLFREVLTDDSAESTGGAK